MSPSFVVLLFISSIACSVVADVRGVKPADQAAYAGPSFTCRDRSKSVPIEYVNDDFCDCEDGSDEPGTSACPKSNFWCLNKGFKGTSIPASRVNDAICDCCDGSDEYLRYVKCADNCEEQGKVARQGLLEKITAIEQGVKLRDAWAAEGKKKRADQITQADELQVQLTAKQKELTDAQAVLTKEEEAERAERQKLDEQREKEVERIKAEYAAKHPPVAETQPPPPQQQDTAAATQAQTETAATPASPASAGTTEGDGVEKQAEAEPELFPYPKEYAFPQAPATDQTDQETHDHDEGIDNEAAVHTDAPAAAAEDELPLPPPVNFTSPAAEEARKIVKALEDSKRDLQKKHDDLRTLIEFDFGTDQELMSLYDKCFEYKMNQYVYEFCPYKRAEQKEGGRGTSLGRFDRYNRDKQEMSFTNGQTCWNGPARSLTVKLECGAENRLLPFEEPSKCVYATTFQTPALCDSTHAQALRLSLEAAFSDDSQKPPVHTEL